MKLPPRWVLPIAMGLGIGLGFSVGQIVEGSLRDYRPLVGGLVALVTAAVVYGLFALIYWLFRRGNT